MVGEGAWKPQLAAPNPLSPPSETMLTTLSL